jgi:outer membrane receptor protein involved in Fe transport
LIAALLLATAACLGLPSAGLGATNAFLSGVVTRDGAAVPAATVTASGNNVIQRTTSDTRGRFQFAALGLGTYDVSASAGDRSAKVRVDLGSSGASITLALVPSLTQIGSVVVVRSPSTRGSGSDTTLNGDFLTRSPASGSFSELLIQLPGTARGANGVVHMNGDHGDINYIVDGVPIPQALNRQIGSEFDPSDVAFADIIEGAYPAQYGERFGGIVNISTRAGTGAPSFSGDFQAGSYASGDATLGYHAPLGATGGLAIFVRNQRGTRGLDPPNFDSPHNNFSDSNQLIHLTVPVGAQDFLNATLTHSFRAFQIPNDVQNGEPASTDDNEKQEDTFLSLQFRHAVGDRGLLTFGPALKVSRIRDFGDPVNDFAFGEALNLGSGGTSTDCATAVMTGNFGPTVCGYSLGGDRTATDYRFQSDFVQRVGAHEVRAGITYDATRVAKRYDVTLQPGNFLAPIFTSATPNAAYTVVDANPNTGQTYEAYGQDSWRLGERWLIDYGARYDHFSIASTNFTQNFTQFSPRLKVTRLFGPRTSAYAYFGRFFTPFSYENVDPAAAQLLNLPVQPVAAQFDLKPERDTMLEAGGHLPIGRGNLGLRVWQKNAADLIDDTQVGVTLLHQDINYQLGRLSSQSAFYELPLARNGRAYVSVAHTLSLNKGCETQLLAPCFGSPTDWTPADHDQNWDATAGVLVNDRHSGWFAADAEYGSGLSSAVCPDGTPGFCKKTPHLTFNVAKGIGIAKDVALTLRVRNVLNDRYYVTLLNAQGNHFAPPRTFDLGLRFGK